MNKLDYTIFIKAKYFYPKLNNYLNENHIQHTMRVILHSESLELFLKMRKQEADKLQTFIANNNIPIASFEQKT